MRAAKNRNTCASIAAKKPHQYRASLRAIAINIPQEQTMAGTKCTQATKNHNTCVNIAAEKPHQYTASLRAIAINIPQEQTKDFIRLRCKNIKNQHNVFWGLLFVDYNSFKRCVQHKI
jgi:predicted metal-binding protein